MGGGFSTDFKSSNRIESSWLVHVLLNFDWFWGSPLGGWQVGGLVWGDCGCVEGAPCTMHTHACMHMHTHTHTHMHVKHDKHRCLHVSGHLQFLYMYTCVCMHVHVHMCRDIPHAPRCPQIPYHTPAPCPELQGAQNTNILILFEDSLSLNIPELI